MLSTLSGTLSCAQNVTLDKAGHIQVDEYQNTAAENIYALGDVCGKALLTPGEPEKYFITFFLFLVCVED